MNHRGTSLLVGIILLCVHSVVAYPSLGFVNIMLQDGQDLSLDFWVDDQLAFSDVQYQYSSTRFPKGTVELNEGKHNVTVMKSNTKELVVSAVFDAPAWNLKRMVAIASGSVYYHDEYPPTLSFLSLDDVTSIKNVSF